MGLGRVGGGFFGVALLVVWRVSLRLTSCVCKVGLDECGVCLRIGVLLGSV